MKTLCIRFGLASLFALAFTLGMPAFAQQTAPPSDDDSAIPADDPAEDASTADSMAADTPANVSQPAMRDPNAMDPAPADPSLLPVFKQFGELPGLTALMDDFMVQLLADPRTRPFFEQADQASVKKHLTEQFCVILGGPCTYTGRDMKTTHAGLGINRGNFNALVEDLQIAMTKHHVPFHAQNKLLAKLAPMHREIETK